MRNWPWKKGRGCQGGRGVARGEGLEHRKGTKGIHRRRKLWVWCWRMLLSLSLPLLTCWGLCAAQDHPLPPNPSLRFSSYSRFLFQPFSCLLLRWRGPDYIRCLNSLSNVLQRYRENWGDNIIIVLLRYAGITLEFSNNTRS